RRVVRIDHSKTGDAPCHRASGALGDDRVPDGNVCERAKMPVPVGGDDARPAFAREDAATHVPRASSELRLTNAFDDHLVETEARDDDSSDRDATRRRPARAPDRD